MDTPTVKFRDRDLLPPAGVLPVGLSDCSVMGEMRIDMNDCVHPTIYHVARNGWEIGMDLVPLARQYVWGDNVAEIIESLWPGNDPWSYYTHEGNGVHCFESLEQAREFRAEYGGVLLAVDASNLDVRIGREFPHPVVHSVIAANRIKVCDAD